MSEQLEQARMIEWGYPQQSCSRRHPNLALVWKENTLVQYELAAQTTIKPNRITKDSFEKPALRERDEHDKHREDNAKIMQRNSYTQA